jgi:hypothetical protein
MESPEKVYSFSNNLLTKQNLLLKRVLEITGFRQRTDGIEVKKWMALIIQKN